MNGLEWRRDERARRLIKCHPPPSSPPPQHTHPTRRREQGGGAKGEEGEEGAPDANDYYVGGNSARGGGRYVCVPGWVGRAGFVVIDYCWSFLFHHHNDGITHSGLSVVGPPSSGGDGDLVAGIFERARCVGVWDETSGMGGSGLTIDACIG